MDQLATGIGDVGRGFRVLNAHPRLWKWVIAPAVLTAALLLGLVALIVHLVAPLHGWLTAHLPGAIAHAASWLVTTGVVVALATGALLIFVPLAGLITGPFNERLSEHVEATITGRPPPEMTMSERTHALALGAVHGLRRLLVSLAGIAIVFAIGFVPAFGTLAAAVLGAWLAARGSAYDSYDAILARRLMPYRAKLSYLAHHRHRTFGLGATVAAMLLVPGLNLIALGLGAAGATVGVLALERDSHVARGVSQPHMQLARPAR